MPWQSFHLMYSQESQIQCDHTPARNLSQRYVSALVTIHDMDVIIYIQKFGLFMPKHINSQGACGSGRVSQATVVKFSHEPVTVENKSG